MRLNARDSICGLPVLEVRKALRRLALCEWNQRPLQTSLEISDKTALDLIRELSVLGYIEPSEHMPTHYVLTTKGNALVQASAARPIKRSTADTALHDLLDRAADVNADPRFIVRVSKIEVFGSYLDPTIDRLGDVDLIVDLEPKQPSRWRGQLGKYRPVYAHGGTIFEMVTAPTLDVRRHLKGRSRIFSLHETGERDLIPVDERQTLFEPVPGDPPSDSTTP